jgi:hypothetical protein
MAKRGRKPKEINTQIVEPDPGKGPENKEIEEFKVDFSKKIPEMKKVGIPIRNTSPIEEKRQIGMNETEEMTVEEIKIEKVRQKKLVEKLTSERAHILDNTPRTQRCAQDSAKFCEEEGCMNWEMIGNEKKCLVKALNMKKLKG